MTDSSDRGAILACIAVAVVAFLVGAVPVRESEAWLHLADGRAYLTQGAPLGSAPFSVSQPHHRFNGWGFEALLYGVHATIGPAGPTLLRAFGLATAALLLMAASRFTLTAAGMMLFGIVAVAPWLRVEPLLGGLFCMALLTAVLVASGGLPRGLAGKFAIAGIVCLWANLSDSFPIAPAVVAALTVRQGARAALIGFAIACVAGCLSPAHIHGWFSPPELSAKLANLLMHDPDIAYRFATLTTAGILDLSGADGGNPVNAVALLALLGVGIVIAGLRRAVRPVGVLALLLFAASFATARAVPFLVVALVATSAGVGRLSPGWGRFAGRGALLAATSAAMLACVPGWLHSTPRRLGFGMEPDPGLVGMLETLHDWRTTGKLPADAIGTFTSVDIANLAAWYAPGERHLVDARLDAIEETSTAGATIAQELRDTPPKFDGLGSYVVITAATPTDTLTMVGNLQLSRRYQPQAVVGRAVLFGKVVPNPVVPRLNLVAQAFGPKVLPLTAVPAAVAPVERDLAARFVSSPVEPPVAAMESLLTLAVCSIRELQFEGDLRNQAFQALVVGGLRMTAFLPEPVPRVEREAHGVFAVRLARQAILDAPTHPDGYLALAIAYADSRVVVPPVKELNAPTIVGLQERFFARTSPAEQQRRGWPNVAEQAFDAFRFHDDQRRRLDAGKQANGKAKPPRESELAYEALKRARDYFAAIPAPTASAADRQKLLENLDGELKRRAEKLAEQNRLFDSLRDPKASPTEQARLAWRENGLFRKALALLTAADDPRNDEVERIAAALDRMDLYLLIGATEDCFALIERMRTDLTPAFDNPQTIAKLRERNIDLPTRLSLQRRRLALLVGQYELLNEQLTQDQATLARRVNDELSQAFEQRPEHLDGLPTLLLLQITNNLVIPPPGLNIVPYVAEEHLIRLIRYRAQLAQASQALANMELTRGRALLEQGALGPAVLRFQEARRQADPESPLRREAEGYLRLLAGR